MADIRNRTMTLADCRFDWTFYGYDKAFDGTATFSDIDGAIYLNGRYLFIELKFARREDGFPILAKGQKNLYKALARDLGATCLLVAGDMQRSVPFFIEDIGTGIRHDLSSLDEINARKFLRQLFSDWNETTIADQKEGNTNE
jgi:hypothetical protein